MAEIALRAYVKEIDDLVEREQLDEAIAHSRHILETYPKHLDTYRLLGKAYLEAKRYGDAADLFQRVLSAIPDDFVAHIGMSIVREDEGNLDASIWHMERAFETNPANPAIQQELRRLIGKRDGLEPHKVRLTRGALARMYAHGELYPQAIAELRSALQEDPDRPDLQVLLVSLHWRTDQKEQAAEVARQVLEKLPFCREANRVVAGALQAGGKGEEGAPYHRRLAALDPYAAFVETALTDPATVDAGSVHLQKLEWRPGHPVSAPEPARPSWSDSLGAGLRAEPKA
ncbi:MAG: tetratricopeptide repeat protein, partial [Chloroflexi bacterium]|nr:tetratricopeptide repeat protein [Chloroflexota bacterium]